jgi:hypothetical protein
MKKLLLSTAAFISAVIATAQPTPASLKSAIKTDKKMEAGIKKDEKKNKKELKKLEGPEVNYQAKQAFTTEFGNVPAKWERLDNFDEATFNKDGVPTSAFYDWNSELVGTTQNKKYTDLPAAARSYIAKKYPGYTTGNVLFFNDNEENETDMILYNNQFEDVDSYFVELKKDNQEIVVQALTDGTVYYYTRLR